MKLRAFTFLYLGAFVAFSFLKSPVANAQSHWFADGYHGGVYGHYPMYVTQLMVDTLNKYPDWKINLEIEPETWDSVEAKDPKGYKEFKKLFEDQSVNERIEYTDPSYAQSYLFPVSGESIIRQFQYGMKKLKQHFPSAQFTTYSSEEPCFTSALPQLLKSLGFSNAVLKNPNTCWGGYTRAHGGETVDWMGPDGTSLITVPRYASEALEPNSTWQTTAWNNSKSYVDAAIAQGIGQPIGMCLQDAGWKNGRWLGNSFSKYTTWQAYFANVANKETSDKWHVSQEDILVSLVWGSQILQRIAQQVRASENKMIAAEKMASLAKLYTGLSYPKDSLDAAWRPLLLSQHHDCWIVPYNKNGNKGLTWAGEVKEWTTYTNEKSDEVIGQSEKALTGNANSSSVAVYNTTGFEREEVVNIPASPAENKKFTGQFVKDNNDSSQYLLKVKVPAMGYAVIDPTSIQKNITGEAKAQQLKDGTFLLETDLYKLIIDPEKGGTVKSLVAKKLDNKEFVDQTKQGFNSLRGNFYTEGGLQYGSTNKANISILENGPLRVAVQIKGTIASYPFTQIIQLTQGDEKIDCRLHVDDVNNLRVGEDYKQDSSFDAKDVHKAFYNDTDKLIAVFPLSLQNQKVYKDAPFDVTESRLNNTFFNRWDNIKNNIILNWVDVTDGEGKYGFSLLTDHTTSYTHGEHFPLGLTVQYAGVGLWGRNYKTDSVINIHYAFIPHKGRWNEALLNKQTECWNTPLLAVTTAKPSGTKQSFADVSKTGWQITSMTYEGNDMLVRFYNAEGNAEAQNISFNCNAEKVELIELNNKVAQTITNESKESGKTNIQLSIPRFGIRTLRFVNAKK